MNRPNRYISRDALKNSQISFHDLREYYKDKDWSVTGHYTGNAPADSWYSFSFSAVNFIRKGMGYEEYLREYAQFRRLKPEELLEILDRIHESIQRYEKPEAMGRLYRGLYGKTE